MNEENDSMALLNFNVTNAEKHHVTAYMIGTISCLGAYVIRG